MVSPDNPYEPPRESGYERPEDAAWWRAMRAWLADRFLLLGCGLMTFFILLGAWMFVLWLSGKFP